MSPSPAENVGQGPMFLPELLPRSLQREPLSRVSPLRPTPMNMAVALAVPGAKMHWPSGTAAGTPLMTVLSDERPSQAISVLLVEDDAPTLWRLQDALTECRLSGHGRGDPGGGARLPRAAGAKSTSHRSATARWPRHRADPRNTAALSRYRNHGDLDSRRRGERDLRHHRRRHRLSPEGRLSDRYRHHRARTGRRAFADLRLDRPLHRAPDPGAPNRRRGRSSTPQN